MPPDPACAPRGFVARVRIYRLSDGHTVTRATTAADGRFGVRLGAGRYGVSAHPASGRSLPRCPAAVRVTVRTGTYSRVTIDCDSGIR
jgi:hypothetical protein